jgi:predicted DNA-binding protein with PD1-like motif
MKRKIRKLTPAIGTVIIVLSLITCDQPSQGERSSQGNLPPIDIHTPDSVDGNDIIPATMTLNTGFERIVIVRLKYRTDILQGLKDAVEKEAINNAVILSGIGSTYSYHVHSVDNATFPSENVFYKEEKPNDIVSISGYVIDGRVHAHIGLSDGVETVGGHLEPGTNVFTFCIITIGVIEEETSLFRFDDKTWR